MRLDAVAFCSEGAKTSSEDLELLINITHPGEESFIQRDNESITFSQSLFCSHARSK